MFSQPDYFGEREKTRMAGMIAMLEAFNKQQDPLNQMLKEERLKQLQEKNVDPYMAQQAQPVDPQASAPSAFSKFKSLLGIGGTPAPTQVPQANIQIPVGAGGGQPTFLSQSQTKSQNGGRDEQVLSVLTPQGQELVKGLVDGTLDPTRVAGLRNDHREKLVGLAKMYDPNFDMKNYPIMLETRKQFTTGVEGDQIQSFDTFLNHLDFLNQQVEGVDNKNFRPQNAVINWAKQMTGDPSITDFKVASSIVDSELERLLTGVGVTQQGLAHRRTILDENASASQWKSAIGSLAHIAEARMKALDNKYKRGMGSAYKEGVVISPETKSILEKLRANKKTKTSVSTSFSPEEEALYQDWVKKQKQGA